MVRRTMCQLLVEYLAIQSERDVTLSFSEIEAIIGRSLSLSAMTMASIWHTTTHVQVRRWREMGWHAHYDWRSPCVHFSRDTEG